MATIRVIDTEEAFLALKPTWDGLLERNHDATAFQSFDWNWHGWKAYERPRATPKGSARLFILDVTRDGHPEEHVIFPFWLDHDGVLRFIVGKLSDHCDSVYATHEGQWHHLYSDVVKYIAESDQIKGIELKKMMSQTEMLAYFTVYYPHCKVYLNDSYSFLRCPKEANTIQMLEHLTSKEKSYVRTIVKRAPQDRFHVLSAAHGDKFPLKQIKMLRDSMCRKGIRQYAFFPDEGIDFMEGVFDAGVCEIAVFDSLSNETFDYISFRLKNGKRYCFWLVLYEDQRLNTMADALYMMSKSPDGDLYLDFGTGAYPYKLGTFRPEIGQLFTVVSNPPTLKTALSELTQTLRWYVKSLIRRHG